MNLCTQCSETQMCEPDTICFSCWCPDKQERENHLWRLKNQLESARWTTRKEFAAAAITVAARELDRDLSNPRLSVADAAGPTPASAIADRAFEIADAMMAKAVFPIPKDPAT